MLSVCRTLISCAVQALRFFMSNNVTVQGLRVQDSPEFHFRFDSCRGVHVDSLSISSPALSPNTDGIHVENTQDVLITNTVVSNGDDCVSIGAGTLNVHIENVTCGPGHGIRFASTSFLVVAFLRMLYILHSGGIG